MKSCVISFSGGKGRTCPATARVLMGALFLSARSFGRAGIDGGLMDAPEVREAVSRFINAQEVLS